MNDIVIENRPPFSLWRLDIQDIEGRVYEIRDGNDAIARFAEIVTAINAFDAITKGNYED